MCCNISSCQQDQSILCTALLRMYIDINQFNYRLINNLVRRFDCTMDNLL